MGKRDGETEKQRKHRLAQMKKHYHEVIKKDAGKYAAHIANAVKSTRKRRIEKMKAKIAAGDVFEMKWYVTSGRNGIRLFPQVPKLNLSTRDWDGMNVMTAGQYKKLTGKEVPKPRPREMMVITIAVSRMIGGLDEQPVDDK